MLVTRFGCPVFFDAREEAESAINDAIDLSPEIRNKALENLRNNTYTRNTVAAGNAKKSVSVKICNGKICGE